MTENEPSVPINAGYLFGYVNDSSYQGGQFDAISNDRVRKHCRPRNGLMVCGQCRIVSLLSLTLRRIQTKHKRQELKATHQQQMFIDHVTV
jgi:hypothetical protein